MHEIVTWLDFVNSKMPQLGIYRPAFATEPEHEAVVFVQQLEAFDASLTPPATLKIKSLGRQHHVRRAGGKTEQDQPDETALAMYKAIRRRLSRRIEGRRMGNRFSQQRWIAERSNKAQIALLAWRNYWEGYNLLQSNPSVFTSGKWRANFLNRYRQLYRKRCQPDAEVVSASEAWANQRVVAAACMGTFAECLRRAAAYSTVEESSRLADEITGELVPVCTTGATRGGDHALHFWADPQFMKVSDLLNETHRAA